MSKLSKLINNPKLFAIDSKIYRRLALLKNRGAGVELPSVDQTWHSVPSDSPLLGSLRAEIARKMPVIDLSEPGEIEVGLLRGEVHKVSEFLYELSRRPSLKIELDAGRKRQLGLSGAHLFAIDDFIAQSRIFSAHVATGRPRQTVKVTFQFWEEREDHLVGPKPNRIVRRLSNHTVESLELFQPGKSQHGRDLHDYPLILEPDFPIDVVYTWVNHQDPAWRKMWAEYTGIKVEEESDDGKSLDRFKNRDELKYSLRSVMHYAPWVRMIYVVTNCAAPEWLDLGHPKIQWVDHAEVFPPDCLPTFSSHAIETRLHHVPGLSNHFLYFNDDVFLTRWVTPGDFFFCNGMSKSFMEDSGVVVGDVHPDDPDYLNAARNGKRLIESTFQRSVTQLHKHSPFALRKDVLMDMEEFFARPVKATTASRFRSARDISAVSFLYHHYAYLTCRGVYVPSDAMLLKYRTPNYEGELVKLMSFDKRPLSVCLNDGVGSTRIGHWERHVTEFLDAFFPTSCELERSETPSGRDASHGRA